MALSRTVATTDGLQNSWSPWALQCTRLISTAEVDRTVIATTCKSSVTISTICMRSFNWRCRASPACRFFCWATVPAVSCHRSTSWSTSPPSRALSARASHFQVYAPAFALAALKGLSHLAPHAHVLFLKNEDFSRDPEVVRFMDNDPLIAHEAQPTRTVAQLVYADERLSVSSISSSCLYSFFTEPLTRLQNPVAASSSSTLRGPRTRRSNYTKATHTTC